MTSPPQDIVVRCPKCGREYQDWYRPSVNLALDDFDEEYLDECSSATCPFCRFKVHIDTLLVDENGIFHFGRPE